MTSINRLSIMMVIIALVSLMFGSGFAIGCLTMVVNIQILARGWAPMILDSKRGGLALASTIGSFVFLAGAAFGVYRYLYDGLIGFALGVASLAIISLSFQRRLESMDPSLRWGDNDYVNLAFEHVGNF